jgi:hypothetical protein
MARTTQILIRRDFDQIVADMDADTADQLRCELSQWDGGDSCDWVEVSVDSRGNVDSESSPRPAGDERKAFAWAAANQGFSGTLKDWLALPAADRQSYEDGAAGIPTA